MVALSNIINNESETAGTSVVTDSITPVANRLYLLTVVSRTNITADPNQPTVTGAGLTWVAIGSVIFDTTSSSRRRVTLFRAMGSSPTTEALTIDFGGQTQGSFTWSVDEATGMDTSGTNGSGAIVQSATNTLAPNTGTALEVTLAAFSDVNNATFGAFGFGGNTGRTGGTGFTELANRENAGNATTGVLTEYKAGNDTTVDVSCTNSDVGGIAIEIKVAGGAATVVKDIIGMGIIAFPR